VHRPELPFHISDVKGHPEGVHVTCAAKKCEHIFGKTIDVVFLTVVCVEENRNMFPGCNYSVCMGTNPLRTRLTFLADCNGDLSLSRMVM
jgi:hypothetical protein